MGENLKTKKKTKKVLVIISGKMSRKFEDTIRRIIAEGYEIQPEFMAGGKVEHIILSGNFKTVIFQLDSGSPVHVVPGRQVQKYLTKRRRKNKA